MINTVKAALILIVGLVALIDASIIIHRGATICRPVWLLLRGVRHRRSPVCS